jgi:hypothetical protein
MPGVTVKCAGYGAHQTVARRELAGFENAHAPCAAGIQLEGTLEDLEGLPRSSPTGAPTVTAFHCGARGRLGARRRGRRRPSKRHD